MFVLNRQHTVITILDDDYLFLTKVAGALANVGLMGMSDYCFPAALIEFIPVELAFNITVKKVKFPERFQCNRFKTLWVS
jgi:hypothetical protein